MVMRNAAFNVLVLCFVCAPIAPAKAPFSFDAMMKLYRIDDPQASPDGKLVAFTVQTVDMGNNVKPTFI